MMKRKKQTYPFLLLVVVALISGVVLGSRFLNIANFTRDVPIYAELDAVLGRGWLIDADWSSDDKMIAVSSSIGVWLYDSYDLQIEPKFLPSNTSPVSSVAFSSDGDYLIEGRWDNRVYLWQMDVLSHPKSIFRGHQGFVNDVAVHPLGQWIVSASSDKTVRIWDVETQETTLILPGHDNSVEMIQINSGGTLLASAGRDNTVRLWDVNNGEMLAVFDEQDAGVYALEFNENDRYLHIIGLDLELFSYSLETQKLESSETNLAIQYTSPLDIVQQLSEITAYHLPPINTIVLSPDSRYLTGGTGNIFTPENTVQIWDMQTYQPVAKLDNGVQLDNVLTLSYQPNHTVLAAGDASGRLLLWDYQSDTIINQWQAHDREILSMIFVDEETLATGSADGLIRVWDVMTGEEIHQFESPNGAVHNIILNDVDKFDELDNTLTSYTVSEAERSLQLLCSHGDEIGAVAFSPDNQVRATVTYNHQIQLVNVASGEFLRTLSGHDNLIEDITFSSDGRWIASAGWDNTVRLWDVNRGQELLTLTGHTRPVTSIVFSGDNTRLISSSDDGTVRIWSLYSLDG